MRGRGEAEEGRDPDERASMRPRTFRRGRSLHFTGEVMARIRFNEAPHFHAGKARRPAAPAPAAPAASMRPRTFMRGRCDTSGDYRQVVGGFNEAPHFHAGKAPDHPGVVDGAMSLQ